MAGFRKRTYASRPFSRNVRRKFGGRFKRRGRYGRGRRQTNTVGRSVAWTSQSGVAHTLGFKARKLGLRKWRGMLWRDTMAMSHYRSYGCLSTDVTLPVSSALMQTRAANAFAINGGNFWTAAGGTVPLDNGTTVPQFQGDITLRGGKVGCSVWNNSTIAPIVVEVYLIRDATRPTLVNLPVNPAVGFDMSTISEFKDDIGTILYRKKVTVNIQEVAEFEYRLKPMKIDQLNWLAPIGSQLTWIYVMTDYSGIAANIVRCSEFFNVSFSADVSEP